MTKRPLPDWLPRRLEQLRDRQPKIPRWLIREFYGITGHQAAKYLTRYQRAAIPSEHSESTDDDLRLMRDFLFARLEKAPGAPLNRNSDYERVSHVYRRARLDLLSRLSRRDLGGMSGPEFFRLLSLAAQSEWPSEADGQDAAFRRVGDLLLEVFWRNTSGPRSRTSLLKRKERRVDPESEAMAVILRVEVEILRGCLRPLANAEVEFLRNGVSTRIVIAHWTQYGLSVRECEHLLAPYAKACPSDKIPDWAKIIQAIVPYALPDTAASLRPYARSERLACRRAGAPALALPSFQKQRAILADLVRKKS